MQTFKTFAIGIADYTRRSSERKLLLHKAEQGKDN
jgi:hypothetical protein